MYTLFNCFLKIIESLIFTVAIVSVINQRLFHPLHLQPSHYHPQNQPGSACGLAPSRRLNTIAHSRIAYEKCMAFGLVSWALGCPLVIDVCALKITAVIQQTADNKLLFIIVQM